MNKLTEIREALKAASTEHEWDTDGITIEWKDGHPLRGTYRTIALTEARVSTNFTNPNHENDAKFIAKAPEYITYLLELLEEKDKALNEIIGTYDEGEQYLPTVRKMIRIANKALLTSSNNEGE